MADVTFARNSTTQDIVLKQYTSIDINSGDTVTVDGNCRGLFLYCQGDCTIAGTLEMSATGLSGTGGTHDPATSTASSDGASVSATGLRLPMVTSGGSETLAAADFAGCGTATVNAVANQGAISGNGTIFTLARSGGSGGASGGSSASAGGVVGTTLSSGGGGSGRQQNGTSAAGSTGTCFGGGGSSGGTQGSVACSGDATIFSNGAGGCQSGGGWGGHSPGSGADGGGTIILVVGGDLTITGSITCNGGDATAGVGGGYTAGGGGPGGGNILILYAGTLSNSGTVTASAGNNAGPSVGGTGGAGAVHIEQVTF